MLAVGGDAELDSVQTVPTMGIGGTQDRLGEFDSGSSFIVMHENAVSRHNRGADISENTFADLCGRSDPLQSPIGQQIILNPEPDKGAEQLGCGTECRRLETTPAR